MTFEACLRWTHTNSSKSLFSASAYDTGRPKSCLRLKHLCRLRVMLQRTLEASPAVPQPLPGILACLRGCRVLQGVLAVANGPRGMAPHLVLQTPGMPLPYMQVRPNCSHCERCMVMGISEASRLKGCHYACKLWHLTRRLFFWCDYYRTMPK